MYTIFLYMVSKPNPLICVFSVKPLFISVNSFTKLSHSDFWLLLSLFIFLLFFSLFSFASSIICLHFVIISDKVLFVWWSAFCSMLRCSFLCYSCIFRFSHFNLILANHICGFNEIIYLDAGSTTYRQICYGRVSPRCASVLQWLVCIHHSFYLLL